MPITRLVAQFLDPFAASPEYAIPFHTTYDGEGKRVKKITWNSQGASETTIFGHSAGKLVAEYSDTQVPKPRSASLN